MHVKSKKHERGKTRMAKKNSQELSIIEALKRFDKDHHPSGETLPDSTRVYQAEVATAMLKAGVALTKIDSLRKLLEEHGYAPTSSSNLRQLVPFILEEKISRLQQEINGKHVSVIFDGTTHVCEPW